MHRSFILNFIPFSLLIVVAFLSPIATYASSTSQSDKTYGLPYNLVQLIPQSPNMQGQLPSADLVPYENPQLGVRVSVPSDSQIGEETPNNIVFIANSPTYFRLAIMALPSEGSTMDQQLAEMSKTDPETGNIVNIQNTILSNNQAYAVTYCCLSDPNTGFQAYNILTFTIYNDVVYSLQFIAYEQDFQLLSPLFQQIQSSYQIIS